MVNIRGCLEHMLLWAIAIVIGSITLVASVFFHQYLAPWEPLAIFSSLVPGVVLTFLYLFRRGRLRWLMGIAGGLFLAFSFILALVHGWENQAYYVLGIGVTLIVVAVFAVLIQATWRLRKSMARINAAKQDPVYGHSTALFRDDGERIVTYPNRRNLLVRGAFQVLVLVAIGSALAFVPIDSPLVWWGLWILAGMILFVFLAGLYRLVIRTPTLVVGPDGILDQGSLLVTGRGLLRWEEIHKVFPFTMSSGIITNRFLVIVVPNGRAVRDRQPLWKRVLMHIVGLGGTFRLTIRQDVLDVPADTLATQITRYVQTHAPPGWIEAHDDKDADRSVQS